MRTLLRATAAAALLAAAALAGATTGASAQDGGPPPPTSGTLLVSDLQSTQGATIGPDGALYVGEAGTGGDTPFETPEGTVMTGFTGRISRIDPATGARTTVADGIASAGFPEGGAAGIVDVAFMGNTLYYLTSGLPGLGFPDVPNGIYRVQSGDDELIADISEFNDDNPVDFEDAAPGGNPFGLAVRGNTFIVTDGNYNRVLQVTTAGDISILVSFENVVPTGIETNASGPIYVTQFSAFPHAPADSKIMSIALPSGTVAEVASGIPQMIDVEFGQGGQLYALNFGDPAEEPESEPPPSGKVIRVNTATGELTPLVDGIAAPTSLDFSGDTAFVTNLLGQVWKIDAVSTLQALPSGPPPAPSPVAGAPTATPRPRGVTAPDTGTGPSGSDDGTSVLPVVALALVGAALFAGGAAVRARR